ncbi:hypothetical protein [Streptococcus infantarius]|uniref:hypothetical protein n=1 Tax=Streptococcus infantarius TaxID=102684 RepID=UPI003D0C3F4C
MEYTVAEKDILNLMERTNFKNLSKNDVITYASKLGELRPEVAKEVLAQYPQFVSLINSNLTEYKSMIDSIIASDDKSIENYFEFANKEQAEFSKSRAEYYSLLGEIQSDYSKILNTPDLSPEQKLVIMENELKLAEMASNKDKEIREYEEKLEEKVNAKDFEKRKFNWQLVSTASIALAVVIGIGASVLGGDLNLKLPNNKK